MFGIKKLRAEIEKMRKENADRVGVPIGGVYEATNGDEVHGMWLRGPGDTATLISVSNYWLDKVGQHSRKGFIRHCNEYRVTKYADTLDEAMRMLRLVNDVVEKKGKTK